MDHIDVPTKHRGPWNKAKLVGQKAPLKLKEIWAMVLYRQRVLNQGYPQEMRGNHLSGAVG